MANIAQLLTEHIDIWTAADTEKKSGRGRASSNAGSVYGVKKLRELILELAVRGRLVPQDPNDEPASELLKRIQAEKAKLIAEGKLKKEKLLTPITEDEKQFELPKGWAWARLSQIAEANTGYAFKSNEYTSEGTFVLRVTNINPDSSMNLDDAKYISTESANTNYRSFLLSEGDVLLVMVGGSLGKIGVVDKACLPAVLNQNMWKLSYIGQLEKKYFIHGLRFINNHQIVITESTHGHLAQGEYLSKLFPLPPLAEQNRIVAKVDELMALCDQLEQQHSNAQEAHETLVSQLLVTLTQSQNTAEFNTNWQRIYAHFDVMFTTEASIDTLKQTLLQLAVMGKLVPQDPNDEPASELLKRIQAEKAKLIVEGKLKKEKPLAQMAKDEKPYETPAGWSWVRLNELLTKIGAGSTPLGGKQVYVQEGIPFLRSQNVWNEGLRLDDVAFITSDTHEKMSGTHIYTGDLLFNITGASIGRCAIVPQELLTGNVSQHVTIIRLASTQILRFMHLVLISQHVQQTVMDVQVGVSREGLSIGKLGQFVIPIPPIAEQHRIVAKVDALMALCDQLKTRTQQANQQQQTIADALVVQVVQPTAEIIDLADYRAAVARHAVNKMQSKPYFGRTTLMKSLSLAQSHIGLKLNFQLERKQAGPFDPWIYDFEKQAEQEGWLKLTNTKLINGFTKVDYLVKATNTQKSELIEKICTAEQLKEFDRLLSLIGDKTTEQVEIIATLFAAWNDFLIDGKTPNDDQIIKEVRENWHESKARFTPTQLKESLSWMHRNHLVPQGRLPRTTYQQQLLIN